MIFRGFSKFLLLFAIFPLWAGPPTRAYLEEFYQQYIGEARATIPGTGASKENGLDRFDAQQFMLWDYLIDVTDYNSHFNDVLSMLQNRKMKRLVVLIPASDPVPEFFQPTNTAPNSFIAHANNIYSTMISINPDFYISIFFESGSFSSKAPSGTYPTTNAAPDTYLTNYFPDINAMLDYAKDVVGQVSGIQEITFDPQFLGADKNIQQRLYNYTDEYKYANGLDSTKLGTTIGIDEAPETYSNLSTFPVPSTFTQGFASGVFPTSPSWRSGNNSSLMQTVYIQAYEPSIPALFAAGATATSASHNGALASQYFNSLLRDQPYLTGAGKISCVHKGTTVTGSDGANFSSYSDAILFAPQPEIAGNPLTKLSVVSSVDSPTQMTTSACAFTLNNSPFQRTEIAAAWTSDLALSEVSQAEGQRLLDNIVWMFSLNYTSPFFFFGNWQIDDFMDFIDGVIVKNNTESIAPFKTADGIALTFPSHSFCIYNYNFATTIVNGGVTYNGVKIQWNLTSN